MTAHDREPVEPRGSSYLMPDPAGAPAGDELVSLGADLEPGTLLRAYRIGLFPMPERRERTIGWWSPDPRGVLPLTSFRESRSLRAARRRFTVGVDSDFEAVVTACADPRRHGSWITRPIAAAYVRLFELGWCHSVEVRDDSGALVGGVYGIQVGGLFAGESMYHRATDASKVALATLVELLRSAGDGGDRLFDTQWLTPHLASLGAVEVPRPDYLARLRAALELAPVDLAAALASGATDDASAIRTT